MAPRAAPARQPAAALPPVTLSEEGGVRHLHLGTPWIQGSMRIDRPTDLVLEYVQRMMAWLLFVESDTVPARRALQLGLGAGALTKFCHRRLGMDTTAVELNPQVVAACRTWFPLPPDGPGLRVVLGDAAHWVRHPDWQGTVDALAVDLYDHDAGAPVLDSAAFYADARGLLKAAIRSEDPVVFLENELLYGQSFEVPVVEDWLVPIGRAKIVRRGRDLTITAFSIMVGRALEAAEKLAALGIEAEVIDLRSLRPLDVETLVESIRRTNRLLSVEEGWPVCGIGAELAALAMEHAFDWLDAPVVRVTGKDVPMPYAANLEKLALVTVPEIVEAVHKVTYR